MALDISSPLPTVGGDLGTWGTKLNTAITEIINEAGKDSDIVSLQSTKVDKTNPVLDGTATGTAITTTGEASKIFKFGTEAQTIPFATTVKKSSTTAFTVKDDLAIQQFNFDSSNGTFVIGSYQPTAALTSSVPNETSIAQGLRHNIKIHKQYGNSTTTNIQVYGKSKSNTIGTDTATTSGDVFLIQSFEGVDSTNTKRLAAQLTVSQNGAAPSGGNLIPSKFLFSVGDGASATLKDVFEITNAGNRSYQAILVNAGAGDNLALGTNSGAGLISVKTSAGVENIRLDGSAGNLTMSIGYIGISRGSSVASATTITPTGQIFHITGTTAIATINIPYTGFNGSITIIPDGIFTTTTAGNIALASTAVVGKALIMTYDNTTSKWYPSY